MFESIQTDRQLNALQYLTSLSISLVAHAAVLGVLVVLPLTFFNVLHADEFIDILIAPSSTPVAPTPPAVPATNRPSAGPQIFKGKIGEAPGHIPDGIHPEIKPPVTTGIETIIPGISNLDQGEVRGSMIGEILKLKDPIVVDPPQPPIRRTPIRVSGTIQEGKLIHRVDPIYPKLAIQTRVSGTVILEATIDEEGSVTDLKILEGHPLLNEAAYNAVKQWKYMPTLIGGEPVTVLASVTVIFRIR